MRQMAINNLNFQQRTVASIKTLENQIGQLASSLNQMQSQGFDKLPAQTVVNPKNVSAITLMSGKSVLVLEVQQLPVEDNVDATIVKSKSILF